MTAPGDAPLLPRDLVERMMEAVAEREDTIALAQSGGEMHPVIGLWPIALMQDLEEQLKAGVRKVLHWTDRHGTVAVPFPVSALLRPQHRSVLQRQHAAGAGRVARHAAQDLVMKPGAAVLPVIGIAGWKKSGKTTLVTRLITELTRRGLKVATVKHAHHAFQIDDAETDSARHRRAGASQVAIVSRDRWAMITELQGSAGARAGRGAVLARSVRSRHRRGLQGRRHPQDRGAPHGFVRQGAAGRERTAWCWPSPPTMPSAESGVPVFALDDVAGIADFILARKAAG